MEWKDWRVDERVGNLWEKTCNAFRSNVKEGKKNQRNGREREKRVRQQEKRQSFISYDRGLYHTIGDLKYIYVYALYIYIYMQTMIYEMVTTRSKEKSFLYRLLDCLFVLLLFLCFGALCCVAKRGWSGF